jgi:hypothetical protein
MPLEVAAAAIVSRRATLNMMTLVGSPRARFARSERTPINGASLPQESALWEF